MPGVAPRLESKRTSFEGFAKADRGVEMDLRGRDLYVVAWVLFQPVQITKTHETCENCSNC